MSPEQRIEIAETLRRFDLQVPPEQQKASLRQLTSTSSGFRPTRGLATWPCSGGTTTGWTPFPRR